MSNGSSVAWRVRYGQGPHGLTDALWLTSVPSALRGRRRVSDLGKAFPGWGAYIPSVLIKIPPGILGGCPFLFEAYPATAVDASAHRLPIFSMSARRDVLLWAIGRLLRPRPSTLEQSTCWRPVCLVTHDISSESENSFISAILPRHCVITTSP